MSEIKLAKCPFCDAELKRWDYMPNVFFEHPYNGCILSGKKVSKSEHDINAWNTRKPMERIIERLEEARAECKELQRTTTDAYGYMKMKQGIDCAKDIVKEEGGIE